MASDRCDPTAADGCWRSGIATAAIVDAAGGGGGTSVYRTVLFVVRTEVAVLRVARPLLACKSLPLRCPSPSFGLPRPRPGGRSTRGDRIHVPRRYDPYPFHRPSIRLSGFLLLLQVDAACVGASQVPGPSHLPINWLELHPAHRRRRLRLDRSLATLALHLPCLESYRFSIHKLASKHTHVYRALPPDIVVALLGRVRIEVTRRAAFLPA